MIFSFADDETFNFHRGEGGMGHVGIAGAAGRKLDQLDAATDVRDVNRPSNRIEIVRKHRRRGRRWLIPLQHGWGVGFEWPPGSGGPIKVALVGPSPLPPEPAVAAVA